MPVSALSRKIFWLSLIWTFLLNVCGPSRAYTQDSYCLEAIVVSPHSASYSLEGTTHDQFAVKAQCSWKATSNVSWITITSSGQGNGNGVVTFSVSANSGGSRTGIIGVAPGVFGASIFKVIQEGTNPSLLISGITPNSGPLTGGTMVNIHGSGFLVGASVMIGSIAASVTGVTNTQITATTSAYWSGTYDVTVTNPGGEFAVLHQAFTFLDFFVSSITPPFGPLNGGTVVNIQGSGFRLGASVTIGDTSATVNSVTKTQINATTRAGSTLGTYDVTVTNPGSEFTVLHQAFTYVEANASFFVSSIAPASGPLTGGTVVIIQGSGFQVGASVKIGSAQAAVISVVSTQIYATTAIYSSGTYDVTVTNPGGEFAVLHNAFTYRPSTEQEDLFVPVVVSTKGLNGSFLTSEMTLTNRGSGDVTLTFDYTSFNGTGSGTATDSLAPGQQKIELDAINYLRSLGIPIPASGNQIGTLRVAFQGLSSSADAGVTIRTTTVVPEGRAGSAYPGIPVSAALTSPSYVIGLRQDQADRSNLAIQNAGADSDGPITLRLTVFSGEGNDSAPHVLPDQVLAPGGWAQLSGILASNGLSLSQGYARIERITGAAPYYAYAVINDQVNSDGSFVPPVQEHAMIGRTGLTLPAIIETSAFSSELVLCNWATTSKTLHFFYAGDSLESQGSTAHFDLVMNAGEQRIIPNFVQWLREQNGSGIGPAGPSYVGPLFATTDQGDLDGIFMGARTSTPGGGGEYGVFYIATPYGLASTADAWLYSLRQDGENRSQLAIVNTGEVDANPDTFDIELFDGVYGTKANTLRGVAIGARHWFQFNTILARYAPYTSQGYAHVIRTSGSNSFIAYAVNNDGAKPQQRSDDGAFIASSP